jgi:choline dehydrogenase-like flavoprotein
MGNRNDRNSVVSSRLLVKGIKNLRVADNSVIPFTVGAHMGATAYLIGERCSDFIKDDWN